MKGKFKPVSVQEELGPMQSNELCIEDISDDRSSFLDSTSTNKSSDAFAKQVFMVEILAPSSMQEGFKFMAVYNDVPFPVIVPAGGCLKGQKLIVPFNPEASNSVGMWKDDLFACTRYGLCHPSLICACFCPFILLGQIMTRLKLDWKGNRVERDEYIKTFRTLLLLEVIFRLARRVGPDFEDEILDPMNIMLTWCRIIFEILIIVKIRRVVKEDQNIPSERGHFEDIAYAICCVPCTISQLARQTANMIVNKQNF